MYIQIILVPITFPKHPFFLTFSSKRFYFCSISTEEVLVESSITSLTSI